MKYQKTAIILAGGQGSRMGSVDKAFLTYDGKPFIHYILEKVKEYEEVIVVSNNPEKYQGLNIKVVEDKVKEIGPLGGIYTGLIHSNFDEALVISCDTPFQHKGFIEYMGKLNGNYEVALPIHSSGREPLIALYRKSLISEIEKLIEDKRYKIAFLYENSLVKKVDIEGLKESVEIKKGFKNINTLEELKEVGGER